MTASGAFVALVNDFAESVGLDIPALEPETERRLAEVLPPYGNYGNPLDVTAGVTTEAISVSVRSLLEDPNTGMLFISYPVHSGSIVESFNKGLQGATKPVAIVALGDASPLAPDVVEAVKKSPAVFSRSSDQMLRAVSIYTEYGRRLARRNYLRRRQRASIISRLVGKGAQPEWQGKALLAAAGIPVPKGALVRTPDEAVRLAADIGYPVVLKAQAGELTHKTEVGGVLLNIVDEAGLRAAWNTLNENIRRAAPSLTLDGVCGANGA